MKRNPKFASLYFKDPDVHRGLVAQAGRRGTTFNGLAVEILTQVLDELKKQTGAKSRFKPVLR